MSKHTRHRGGGRFEEVAAYARAARHGDVIAVSGTADLTPEGAAAHPDDAYAQTLSALRSGVEAVEALGGQLEDVIRSRILLAPESDWQGAVRAHAEVFRGIDPANTTLFVAGFIPPGVLVEIELDAVVAGGS